MPWHPVATRGAVERARMFEVEVRGHAILLYDVLGTIYATAAVCPHHSAWFSQGGISGEYVDCPRHQGRFHIPTGVQVRGPECPKLRTYPVRLEGDQVMIELP